MKKISKIKLSILCLLILPCFLFAACNNFSNDNRFRGGVAESSVLHRSATFIYLSQEDLMASASLIVHGTVSEVSEPFEVENVRTGERGFFYNYYVEPHEIFRGNSPSKAIAIRVGPIYTADGFKIIRDWDPNLEIGEEYLLFLGRAGGDVFDTQDEYYHIFGGSQGLFLLSETRDSGTKLFAQVTGDKESTLSQLRKDIEEINRSVAIPDEESRKQEAVDGLSKNIESGFLVMSEEEYKEMVDEIMNRDWTPARIVE
jgi:hypothetical protein